MPKLIILKDGKEMKSFTLEADLVQIGSAEGNTIRIKSAQISREHCEIRRTGMQFRLVDLESKTGTRVNGTYVNQHLLEEGDRIELGELVLEFRRNGVSAGVSRAAPHVDTSRAPAERRPSAARRPAPSRRGHGSADRRSPPRPASSALPLVMLFSAMGLVLVIVVAVVVGGGGDDRVLTENESPLAEMQRREASGDGSSYEERTRVRTAIERLLVRASKARSKDAAGIVAEIDAALARYQGVAEPHLLGQLAEMRARVVAGGGETGGAAAGSLQGRFEAMEKEAYALQDQNRFGEAIALWDTFLERNRDLLTSTVARQTYEPKVKKKQDIIVEIVRSRWGKIVDRAAWLVARGEPERAIKLFEQQAGAWGMEQYSKMAESEINKIKAGQ